jgi:outer membrane protein TolC
LDSNKLQSDLAQTRYLYAQAKLQAQDALLDLAAALQLPAQVPVVFMDDTEFQGQLEHNADINSDHATNADMALASSQLESSKADEKSAYADFLPTVTGSANYGPSGSSPGHSSDTYFVGVQATLPIWEGGSQQANLAQAKSEIKEAQEKVLDTNQQEQVDIAKARAAITEAYELRQAKLEERSTAQRSLHITLQSQESGIGSVLQVMQAKSDLATAQDVYNEAQATWVMAHIDLLHAEGRLRELVKKGE